MLVSLTLTLAGWVAAAAAPAPSLYHCPEPGERTPTRAGVTVRLCVAAARGDSLDRANAAVPGSVRFPVGRTYLSHPGSPLVLVYEGDDGTGAGAKFVGFASFGYHWRATRHPALRARLQGGWRTHGVHLAWANGRPKSAALASGSVAVLGAVHITSTPPIAVPVMVAASGPRTVVSANPDAAFQAELDKHPGQLWAPRTFVQAGPVLLTFIGGPDWLELSAWTPFEWWLPPLRRQQ